MPTKNPFQSSLFASPRENVWKKGPSALGDGADARKFRNCGIKAGKTGLFVGAGR